MSEQGAAQSTSGTVTPDTADTACFNKTLDQIPNPLAVRKPSTSQPLRHGRKPIYPDSDAEAEGLDADVDDEQLETGLHPSNGENERILLLSTTGRGKNAAGWSLLDRIKAKLPKSLGGDDSHLSRLARRRNQRRNISSTSSRRNSTTPNTGNWRQDHPLIMRTIYVILSLIAVLLVLIGIAAAHLFLATLSTPSQDAQSRILDESLLLKGPDRLELLNISDDGILVRVDARLGLDPDHALDLWFGQKGKQGWWKNRERKLVEWAMGKVAGVQVDIGEVRLAEIGAFWTDGVNHFAAWNDQVSPQDMMSFHLEPLVLPLPPLNRKIGENDDKDALKAPILGNHSTSAARHNMNPLNLTVLLKPVSPAPYIMEYAQHVLKSGKAKLDVKIRSLRVRGLGHKEISGITNRRKSSFFNVPRRIDISQRLIRSPVQEKVPKVGNDTKTDDLLKLDGYEFFEIGQDDDGDKKVDDVVDFAMRALGIKAKAMAKNPLGRMLKGQVDYSLPFGIYLPVNSITLSDSSNATDDSVLMAVVASEPFALTGQKKINLNIVGRVVPPPKDSKPKFTDDELPGSSSQLVFSSGSGAIKEEQAVESAGMPGEDSPSQIALSNFLSRFLRGDDNTVYVRGGSPFSKPNETEKAIEELPGSGSDLPDWMDSALRLVDLPISFPGSKVTDLIKNVTIEDLKIIPHPFEKDKLLCSGTVTGVMNLPGQLSTVDVKITHLWPDILVFDGKPPSMKHGYKDDDDFAGMSAGAFDFGLGNLSGLEDYLSTFDDANVSSKKEPESAPPLPNPLPPKAFGRVRPYDFTPATTYPDPSDPTGQNKLLRSELKDVPFNVLPGRGPVFRSFTWKIMTGSGALAGIEGTSRAKIWNSGLGTLQLRNLPVKGAFTVGKRD